MNAGDLVLAFVMQADGEGPTCSVREQLAEEIHAGIMDSIENTAMMFPQLEDRYIEEW